MGCPLCGNKPSNCDCTQEAYELNALREEIVDGKIVDEQQEKFEFLKAVAIALAGGVASEVRPGESVRCSEIIKDATRLMNEVWKYKGKL